MRLVLCVMFTLFALTSAASAKVWTIDYDNSYFGFVAHQGDKQLQMRFRKYEIKADFEPSSPEKGKITATMEMPSILANEDEVKSNIPNSDWLDYKMFPKATYATTYIEAEGDPGCFKANGLLTLKGVSKDVDLHFCLTHQPDRVLVKGEAALMRNDFNVGTGQWAEDTIVGHPVEISMNLVAR